MQLFLQHIPLDFVICSSPVERDEIDELRVVLKVSVIHINLVSSSLSWDEQSHPAHSLLLG